MSETPTPTPSPRGEQPTEKPRSPLQRATAAVAAIAKKLKTASSVAIGLDDLMGMSIEELDTVLAAGIASKQDQTKSSKDKSDFFVTEDGCSVSRRTAASKPMIMNPYDVGDWITYPEFNSNVIARVGTRRYRLYQVAAVRSTKALFPAMSVENFKNYATSNGGRLEASHTCKTRKFLTYTTPDGLVRQVEMFEENKACFCPAHMIMEPDFINRSRIKCDGGESCGHYPKCRIVVGA